MPVATPQKKLAELRALNAQIADRKRYLREQEALIEQTLEVGNMKLMALNHDVLLAKQQLRQLKTDIRTATQDKILINRDLNQLQAEISLVAVAVPVMPVLRPLV